MKFSYFLKEYWEVVAVYIIPILSYVFLRICVVSCSDPKSALCVFWLIGGFLVSLGISIEFVIRIFFSEKKRERIYYMVPFWMVLAYMLLNLYL